MNLLFEPSVGVTILIIVLGVWLGIGFYNFRNRLKAIAHYIDLIEKLDKDEKKTSDVYTSAQAFNYRENLKNEYLPLEEIRLELEKNESKTKAELLVSFLFLGPIYNFK